MKGSYSQKIANAAFIFAVFVVIIHCYLPTNGSVAAQFLSLVVGGGAEPYKGAIVRVAVPFFFIVSGYFLAMRMDEVGWWKKALMKRALTLLLPFFIFNCLYVCVRMIAHLFLHVDDGGISKNLLGALGLVPWLPSALGPSWFLKSLYFCVVISPVLCMFQRRLVFVSLILLYIGLAPFPNGGGMLRRFFCWTISLEGLFYFYVGILLSQTNVTLSQRCSRMLTWLSVVVGVCA